MTTNTLAFQKAKTNRDKKKVYNQYSDFSTEMPNHIKVGIKFVILAVILVLGYKNVKKPVVSTKIWATMIVLAVVNLFIALAP